jgi:hypothetical protein
VKGARRCRLAAVAHVTIGTDEVHAFGFGAIAVVERAFGIEDEASMGLRVRSMDACFDGELDVYQVVQIALERLSQFGQPVPRLSLVVGAGEQEQGVLRPAQQLE